MNEVRLEEILRVNDNVVRIIGIENKYDFPTPEHAKRFAEIYMDDLAAFINGRKKLSKEEIRQHALMYFRGGGAYPGDSRSMDNVLDKTQKLYKLSEDIEFLKEIKV